MSIQSKVKFDNIIGNQSLIDHECFFVCDLNEYTKLYTHYNHKKNSFLIIKFDEDSNLDTIYDLDNSIKRTFKNNEIVEEISLYTNEFADLMQYFH